jgi:branched-chain amino acid transport system permease protein
VRRRAAVPVVAWLAFAAVVYALPAFVSDFRAQDLAFVAIYLIALIGLNVLTGYTGQISLGHGAFMAIGGYTTAILVADHGLRDLWTIPLAGLVAGAAGLLFGVPALRLPGLYLALATFAVAVSLPAVLKRFEGFTGGSSGINLFGLPELTGALAPVRLLGLELRFYDWLYYLSWTLALAGLAAGWLLLRGRTGRAFRAIRDSEIAATSSGVSLARYKTLAFGVSAAYAGIAGSLFALATTFVNPDTFPIALSIFLLVGVVLGGLNALHGLVAGAVFLQFRDELGDWITLDLLGQEQRPGGPAVVAGLVLIALMIALPSGVSGLVQRLVRQTTRMRARQ